MSKREYSSDLMDDLVNELRGRIERLERRVEALELSCSKKSPEKRRAREKGAKSKSGRQQRSRKSVRG